MSLKLVLVAGSSQPSSQSAKVAAYLRQRLLELGYCTAENLSLIDLGATPLPLWPAEDASGTWANYAALLREADGVVLISPEWHGMASPALKNFFIYAGRRELGHKPALLVGVSAGLGGAYPLSELRASSYKNCRLCYLPEQLIVRHVGEVLNGDNAVDEPDARIRARADWALEVLVQYAQAMRPLRTTIRFDSAEFINGM
ncbi:MAG: NAD(P)H-dependent oxidoreductase [Moraxellaceae bacterium]|nr:NAD(P)H-dependent oxidoreductase [Moraxellaceae bacterium]MDP1775250.1 NAD(P)H-dependent oxidoreductase [Moraxellaceae bacterium]MDZ4298851.1 NAD(P)H-dependent oxidoreductase [Moraxellaceae bacterium]MDZ4387541.1 NAD(P)H-dependent oxidoreductase [Moraxellaceae bacterium]